MITTFCFIQLIAFQLAYVAAHHAGTSIFPLGGMLPVENKQRLRVMAALLMTVSIALFIMKLGWMSGICASLVGVMGIGCLVVLLSPLKYISRPALLLGYFAFFILELSL